MILKFNRQKIEEDFNENDEFCLTSNNIMKISKFPKDSKEYKEYKEKQNNSVEMQIFLEVMRNYIYDNNNELTADTEVNKDALLEIIKNNYSDIKNNIICKSVGKIIEKIFIKNFNIANIQDLNNVTLYHYGFRRTYYYRYNYDLIEEYVKSFTEENIKIGDTMAILYNTFIHLMMLRIIDYIDLLIFDYDNNANDRIIAVNMDTIQKKFYSFLKDKNRRANYNYNNIITEFNYLYAINDKKQEIFYIGTYNFKTKTLLSFNTKNNINAF